MLHEPIIFFIADPSTVKLTVTLPSGKELLFDKSKNREYKTSDADEIDFLTKHVKRLGARKLKDKEYRLWTTRLFKELPIVTKPLTSLDEVEKYIWTTELEKQIINRLREAGYTILSIEEKAKCTIGEQGIIDLDLLFQDEPDKKSCLLCNGTGKVNSTEEGQEPIDCHTCKGIGTIPIIKLIEPIKPTPLVMPKPWVQMVGNERKEWTELKNVYTAQLDEYNAKLAEYNKRIKDNEV